MATTATIVKIFAASPSDVTDERNVLESVVQEVNRNVGDKIGVRFDLLRWENIKPGFASYPQEHVNTQIGDDYDVFMGILWSRVGTPTPVAESGTLEEFERAFERFKNDPKSIDLLLFFKTADVPMTMIDIDQLSRILKFKESIGEKGGVYKSFKDIADFESIIRATLSEIIHDWKDKSGTESRKATVVATEGNSQENKFESEQSIVNETLENIQEEEDYGLLDYIELYDSSFHEMSSALQAITDGLKQVGDNVKRQTDLLNKEIEETDKPKLMALYKKRFSLISRYMQGFSTTVQINTKTLAASKDRAFYALSRYLVLNTEISPDDKETLNTQEKSLMEFVEIKSGAYESLDGMRSTFQGLPKFTGEFNRSRRESVEALSKLLLELDAIEEVSLNLIKSIQTLKEQEN